MAQRMTPKHGITSYTTLARRLRQRHNQRAGGPTPKARLKAVIKCEDIIQNINYVHFRATRSSGPELYIISLLFCTNAPSLTMYVLGRGRSLRWPEALPRLCPARGVPEAGRRPYESKQLKMFVVTYNRIIRCVVSLTDYPQRV